MVVKFRNVLHDGKVLCDGRDSLFRFYSNFLFNLIKWFENILLQVTFYQVNKFYVRGRKENYRVDNIFCGTSKAKHRLGSLCPSVIM